MKLKHTMGLYFSPRVLEAVLADPGSMEPRRADVTLLLTDLRNSTPLAETLGPQGMFDLLNRVFEAQTKALYEIGIPGETALLIFHDNLVQLFS